MLAMSAQQTTPLPAKQRPQVIFSDVDGTLVHYPKDFKEFCVVQPQVPGAKTVTLKHTTGDNAGITSECIELSSLTGGPSYMSIRTVELISEIRKKGCAFVIITGARSSTFRDRLPSLPPSDFFVWENGGRIASHDYVKDQYWEELLQPISGENQDEIPDAANRKGPLWDAYRDMERDGWLVDARNYGTAFRVDVKKSINKATEEFEIIRQRLCTNYQLDCSFNLGKADFYPCQSGKANAAKYVAKKLGVTHKDAMVALFDDDNDILLGHEAGWSVLPGTTH
eukprot:Ihof_evm2s28 gene=Ihof_evmTU2s28